MKKKEQDKTMKLDFDVWKKLMKIKAETGTPMKRIVKVAVEQGTIRREA